MYNPFRKKKHKQSNELIERWVKAATETGLSERQILGLAYFNSAVPTVLSVVKGNRDLRLPLQSIVDGFEVADIEGANALYLYREIYYAAQVQDSELVAAHFDGLDSDFFDDSNSTFLRIKESETGFFLNSRLSMNLFEHLGKILEDYNITVIQSFNLGHKHFNYLLATPTGLDASRAVIMANILPHYAAALVDMIPQFEGIAARTDLWIFSRILYGLVNDAYSDDQQFAQWIWYLHNAVFYVDKPGSVEIKPEWNIADEGFQGKVLQKVMELTPGFYRGNPHIGNQRLNGGEAFTTWEEFFPLLYGKLQYKYSVQGPQKSFLNIGELCNYVGYTFIAAAELVLENGSIEK